MSSSPTKRVTFGDKKEANVVESSTGSFIIMARCLTMKWGLMGFTTTVGRGHGGSSHTESRTPMMFFDALAPVKNIEKDMQSGDVQTSELYLYGHYSHNFWYLQGTDTAHYQFQFVNQIQAFTLSSSRFRVVIQVWEVMWFDAFIRYLKEMSENLVFLVFLAFFLARLMYCLALFSFIALCPQFFAYPW